MAKHPDAILFSPRSQGLGLALQNCRYIHDRTNGDKDHMVSTSEDHPPPSPETIPPYSGPMRGVRVLDLGVWVAGPFAASLLADFGAEVIKIERPGQGDPIRHRDELEGPGSHWCVDGRNKQSLTLDLSTEIGREILGELIVCSDVLIDNHRPGMLDEWGFSEDRIRELNSGLIVANVSGFGQNGPYAHRLAYDRIAAAMGGLLYLNGYPELPPVRPGLILSDYITALFNAIGILMALYQRDAKGGGGERLDVAMYECIFRILENTVTVYDKFGIVRERNGNVSPGYYPDDMFEAADGKWVVLSAASDHHFAALCRLIGHEELLDDPDFATPSECAKQVPRLQHAIGNWVTTLPSDTVMAQLEQARLPCALVMGADDIMKGPHYHARQTIIDVEDPQFGLLKQPAVTPRLACHPGAVHRGAPLLGGDTEAILRDLLGKTDQEIASLRRQQIV